jgi:hypothetical protein
MVAAKEEQKPMCTEEELKSAYEFARGAKEDMYVRLATVDDWVDPEGS